MSKVLKFHLSVLLIIVVISYLINFFYLVEGQELSEREGSYQLRLWTSTIKWVLIIFIIYYALHKLEVAHRIIMGEKSHKKIKNT